MDQNNSQPKEEKDFLAREEVKTMEKDISGLREIEARRERERISKIKTAEEIFRERERENLAQQAALERDLAEKEAGEREERIKKMRPVQNTERIEASGEKIGGFREAMKETQTREEETRKRFLDRIAARADLSPQPTAPPAIKEEKLPEIAKTFFKKPSSGKKIWIRIILSLLALSILAIAATFSYWYFYVREKPAKPTPPSTPLIEEVVPEAPKNIEPAINERLLEAGYRIPTDPRTIDAIIIHSSYNIFNDDPHDLNGIIQEYRYYGVSPHYIIARDGAIYRLAPDESIAYHAGISNMPDGRIYVNTFSIGIELIQTMNESPTETQYQSLIQLIKYLQQKYSIHSENILGHKDVSPDRKTDPWNFDWEKFNQLMQ